MNTKSVIFMLLILAVAAVAYFLLWQTSQEELPAPAGPQKTEAPPIESTNVIGFDAELEQEIKLFDNDSLDLTNLDVDTSLNNIESDLSDLGI